MFIIVAIVGVVGILVTQFFVENHTGEDLGERDKRFRAFLVENGWVGEMGEEDLKALVDDGQVPGERIVILDEVFAEQK